MRSRTASIPTWLRAANLLPPHHPVIRMRRGSSLHTIPCLRPVFDLTSPAHADPQSSCHLHHSPLAGMLCTPPSQAKLFPARPSTLSSDRPPPTPPSAAWACLCLHAANGSMLRTALEPAGFQPSSRGLPAPWPLPDAPEGLQPQTFATATLTDLCIRICLVRTGGATTPLIRQAAS